MNKEVKLTPVVTSKGRSLLGIAMSSGCLDIVRYLVVEKGLSLCAENDLTLETMILNFESALRILPRDITSNHSLDATIHRGWTESPASIVADAEVARQYNADGVAPNPSSSDDCEIDNLDNGYGTLPFPSSHGDTNSQADECTLIQQVMGASLIWAQHFMRFCHGLCFLPKLIFSFLCNHTLFGRHYLLRWQD
jgi:hypothetical protein